ncbi:hypothetical protein [Paenibacillus campi]|uniref:hypothetical protein n=1 Tax=Paenibacillus campi TaxID=3106031 RepID=UPI002AFFC151|nr:hypothetical protein [Paenibacillus sp. SGZ-1014]
MKVLPFVNAKGFFVEDVMVSGDFSGVLNRAKISEGIPSILGYTVGYPLPNGLYKPRLDVERLKREYKSDDALKWPDGSDVELAMSFWIEGLTPEEIAEITKPSPLSETDIIRQEVANQNSAIWEYLLFGGA